MSDRDQPIVVTGTLRCGSSLVSRIFAEHGVWVGRCQEGDRNNPHGFYENLAIKRWIQRNVDPRNRSQILTQEHPPHPDFRPLVLGTLEREGYRGGPWLVKLSAVYWRLWEQFSPRFVLPRRKLDEVFSSVRRAGYSSWVSDDELRGALRMMDRRVQYLRRSRGGILVDSARMVGGDLSQIEEALRSCDIEPESDLIASLVSPDLWHGEVL